MHAGRDAATGRHAYVTRTVRGDRDAAERALAGLVAQITDSASALQWRHVDFRRQTLHIAGQVAHTVTGPVQRPTKTHAERRLTLDPVTLEELAKLAAAQPKVESDRYIFSHTPDGKAPWRPDYATLAFARLADRLGIAKIRLA